MTSISAHGRDWLVFKREQTLSAIATTDRFGRAAAHQPPYQMTAPFRYLPLNPLRDEWLQRVVSRLTLPVKQTVSASNAGQSRLEWWSSCTSTRTIPALFPQVSCADRSNHYSTLMRNHPHGITPQALICVSITWFEAAGRCRARSFPGLCSGLHGDRVHSYTYAK